MTTFCGALELQLDISRVSPHYPLSIVRRHGKQDLNGIKWMENGSRQGDRRKRDGRQNREAGRPDQLRRRNYLTQVIVCMHITILAGRKLHSTARPKNVEYKRRDGEGTTIQLNFAQRRGAPG